MQASRKPVGLVLMDQSMIAGIGNIYRAEILFKARPGLWHVGSGVHLMTCFDNQASLDEPE